MDLVISVDFSLSFQVFWRSLAIWMLLSLLPINHLHLINLSKTFLTFFISLFLYLMIKIKVTLKLMCIRSPVKNATQFDVLGASNIRSVVECKLTDICHLDTTALCNVQLEFSPYIRLNQNYVSKVLPRKTSVKFQM